MRGLAHIGVIKALDEVGYKGFATAEPPGVKTVEELKDISSRMDRVLGLATT